MEEKAVKKGQSGVLEANGEKTTKKKKGMVKKL